MDWADRLERDGVLRTPIIIEAFGAILREDFVPESMRDSAQTVDAPLPIGSGQTISQPWTVAFMLELLEPQAGQRILDIGAGSGWQAALLAHIVSQESGNSKLETLNPKRGKVYAIERVEELCVFGKVNVAKYNFIKKGIVEWVCVDAIDGLPAYAPFDRIVAAAGLSSEIPYSWREQCVVGGCIVAPIGASIWRFRKLGSHEWQEEEFPGFAFVPFVSDSNLK